MPKSLFTTGEADCREPVSRTFFVKRPSPNSRPPSKDEILAFIGEQKGKVGTREIARAFGLKNADRVELKRMLRELADEGRIEKRRKKLQHPGKLPEVVLADISARDRDGDLIAVPTEWDEEAHGAPPKIRVRTPRRAQPGEVAGVGDRALLRVEETGDDGDAIRHTARVIKLIDRAKRRVLGIFRALPGGGGRLVPIDKKNLGRRTCDPAGRSRRRAGRRSRRGRGVASARLWPLPQGRVQERLGSLKSERAVSLIAIHAHDIPHVFPQAVLKEAEAAQPVRLAGREDWRDLPLITIDPADAKDHDDAVHAAPDPDPKNPGGHVLSVAIADVAHYVRPGSALDREARLRGNSVYFPDRVVPMLPERISNDLCSLRPGEDRAALAVRMVIGADGRKRSHTFHRVLMRSAAKLVLPAGAGGDRRPARRHHRPAARDGAGAALRRLSRPQARARRARAARSRYSRAQDRPHRPRHRRPGGHARAPRCAPADRGVHDPRQCRRRRDA